jgi:hypothetical protein
VNYYQVPDQQKTMKMVALALSGIFGVVLIVAVGVFVHLVKPSFGSAQAAVAVPTEKDEAKKDEPIAAEKATAPATDNVADKAPVHHKASSSAKHAVAHVSGSKFERAVAKTQSESILAKHDTAKNRRAKDDLDKLLGL